MKLALHDAGGKEYLQFMRQLGVEYVVSAVGPGASGALEVDDILRKKEYFAEHDVIWDVIENLDPRIYYKVMLGEEGREEQMDRVCESIRAVGEAGSGVLQYQGMLLGGLRTEYSPTGRGGARVPRFDMAVAARMPAAAMDWLGGGVYPTVPDRELSASQVWDNLRYFLARAVPVAEECVVKLAAHPDDAPVPVYMGVARILVDWDGLQECVDAVPSPNSGLGFCMGTIGTMANMDVLQAIRHFGGLGRIHFAHFRNPRGQVPYFAEVFPDEGDIDMVAAVKALNEVGFDGVIRIDHCPGVIGDNPAADRSFAFQVGYLQGLVQALERLGD